MSNTNFSFFNDLKYLLSIIIDNAIKYTPIGGQVNISAKEYEMFVRVDIKDNGIGISEEESTKIFSRFYRSPRVSGEKGIGIGLYLAREILNKEGCYIKLSSKSGKGSMFSVFIPKAEMLSLILALIGILNFINSMITSVSSRQHELAVLQSIGMTGKQLKNMLIGEGVIYSFMAIIFTLTIGNVIAFVAVNAIANQMWFFTYHFTIMPILLSIPVLLVFAITVPLLCYKSMKKTKYCGQA